MAPLPVIQSCNYLSIPGGLFAARQQAVGLQQSAQDAHLQFKNVTHQFVSLYIKPAAMSLCRNERKGQIKERPLHSNFLEMPQIMEAKCRTNYPVEQSMVLRDSSCYNAELQSLHLW